MYQGYVAGICPRDVLPGNVPGISYILNRYQENVAGICSMDMILGQDSGVCCRDSEDMLRGDRILRKYPWEYVADYVPGVRCRDMPKFFVAKEQVSMCAVTFNWFNINTRTKLNLFLQHTQ